MPSRFLVRGPPPAPGKCSPDTASPDPELSLSARPLSRSGAARGPRGGCLRGPCAGPRERGAEGGIESSRLPSVEDFAQQLHRSLVVRTELRGHFDQLHDLLTFRKCNAVYPSRLPARLVATEVEVAKVH